MKTQTNLGPRVPSLVSSKGGTNTKILKFELPEL